MSWILGLSLLSNPTGHYVREFDTEKECVEALKEFVEKNRDNSDIKFVGCVPNQSIGE